MNKTGFTLIELLGSIVILVTIALIAFPSTLNMIKQSQENNDDAIIEIIKSAAAEYVSDKVNDYPKQLESINTVKTYSNGKICVKDLIKYGYINGNEISDKTNSKFLDDYVEVTSTSKKYMFEFKEGGC